MTKRMERYYAKRPVCENYKGWNIRTYVWNDEYLGVVTDYIVNVNVGVEGCLANTLAGARAYVDAKIAEGKVQKEYV